MRPLVFGFLVCLHVATIFSQQTIEKALERFNSGNVPYISVETLKALDDVVLLDTREQEEFAVSHLSGASWVGHDTFVLDSALALIPDKSTPIVVYCSIGVRSENIGERLQEAGFTQVRNLYGGIFKWKNQGNPVVDTSGAPTENIHAYSKHWGKLLTKGNKVYDTKSLGIATKVE